MFCAGKNSTVEWYSVSGQAYYCCTPDGSATTSTPYLGADASRKYLGINYMGKLDPVNPNLDSSVLICRVCQAGMLAIGRTERGQLQPQPLRSVLPTMIHQKEAHRSTRREKGRRK